MLGSAPRATSSLRLERQFGRVVGGVFLAIGVYALVRGRWFAAVSWTLAVLGFLLVAFSVVYPRALTGPRRAWMALAEAMSFVSTRVILGLVFFLTVLPLGAVMRLFGWDPLARRRARAGESYWRDYPARQRSPKHFEQMF
jgi:hypothetical protein